jgi:molybdopterin molybdotransferase
MIPVEAARERILAALAPVGAETVAVAEALGRVLAEDVAARLTQPPLAVSAMDGWAVRSADVARVPAALRQVESIAAGRVPTRALAPGECARIFTGAPLPAGADAIVIQEDADEAGERITVREGAPPGRHVRPAGLDFRAGEVGLAAGRVVSARDLGLAAAMNRPWLSVRRRPRIAILATGDEIVMPGDPVGPGQIVSSNGLALAAFVRAWGGEPASLGIAPDRADALAAMLDGARGCDLLVTTGGASVGEHDLVRDAIGAGAVDFWRIAMRPGKPMMFGRRGDVPVLGLPGNPVSSLVCALVFLRPALLRLLGVAPRDEEEAAALGRDLPANDRRQDYLRATLAAGAAGPRVATPFAKQDSSMLSLLARADCLVIRPPEAPAAPAGETVPILRLGGGLVGT